MDEDKSRKYAELVERVKQKYRNHWDTMNRGVNNVEKDWMRIRK